MERELKFTFHPIILPHNKYFFQLNLIRILTEQIIKMAVKHTKIRLIENKMNLFIAILLNISLSFTGFNCTKDVRSNDPLPDARPEKLVIEYREDGGMLYYSEALYISEDSSYYTVNDGGAISRVNFKLIAQEFDNLYKIFTDNNFDRIKTSEEKVYDRGGNSVYIRWGKNKYASVSNSGMSFVKDSWQKEWNKCVHGLLDIIKTQSEQSAKNYELGFDKSMFGKEILIYIKNEQVIPKSTLMAEHDYDEYITKTVKLMPGKHRLAMNFDKQYNSYNIDCDSTKGINFFLKNDSLNYKYIIR